MLRHGRVKAQGPPSQAPRVSSQPEWACEGGTFPPPTPVPTTRGRSSASFPHPHPERRRFGSATRPGLGSAWG